MHHKPLMMHDLNICSCSGGGACPELVERVSCVGAATLHHYCPRPASLREDVAGVEAIAADVSPAILVVVAASPCGARLPKPCSRVLACIATN
jgi:hypothetical protein